MLSRVLRSEENRKVEPAVFPSVEADREAGPQGRGSASSWPAPDETVQLRDRLERAEAGMADVRREALENGRRQGEEQARAELKPVLDRLAAALGEIAELRPDLRRRAERDVVGLALLIAKRVLHREVNVDQEALTAIARVAFDRLARAESYRVRVHPRFADAIRAALPASQRSRVEIQADPACAPGTLVIHTPEGSVDASIDTQLEEIERGLTDRLVRIGGAR